MAKGSHLGSFAGGFAKSFTEMMKLYLMQQHYAALKQHYDAQEALWANRGGKGFPTGTYDASAAAGREWDAGGGGGGAYKGGAQAEAHAAEMSDYLQKNYGLTPAGAAGVVGNAWQESSFSSNFKPGGDKGTAAGMFQWRDTGPHAMRQSNAIQWMKDNGKDPNAWQSHLDYAMHETQQDMPGLYKRLQTTTDVANATKDFNDTFERSAPGPSQNMANRLGMAQAALKGTAAAPKTEIAAATTKPVDKQPATKVAKASTGKEGDKPSKVATAEEAETAGGGKFRIPGSDKSISEIPRGPDVDAQATAPAPPLDEGIRQGPTVNAQDDPMRGPEIPPGGITTEAPEGAARPDAPTGGRGLPSAPTPSRRGAEITAPLMGGEPYYQQSIPPGNPISYPTRQVDERLQPAQTSPATINPATDTSPYVQPAHPPSTGRGATLPPDVVANPPPPPERPKDLGKNKEADKPSKSAQTVSSSSPPVSGPAIPNTPASDPRFTMVDRPNADPGRGNSPQATALDLSHLWGPNPPLSQQASAPVTPVSNPRQDDSVPNLTDADFAGLTDQQVMGARKGGPITPRVSRYANGGAIPSRPAMGFAGGGAAAYGGGSQAATQPTGLTYGTWNSPTSATYVPAASQPIMGVNPHQLAVPNPDSSMSGYLPWTRVEAQKVSDPSLTADQKTWYQQQIANAQSQNGSYYYNPASMPTTPAAAAATPDATPAAATPAATVDPAATTIVAPSASTTITDPTTTTVTGAVNLPNQITAKSYDPNVDQQTGAGFANTSNTGGTDYSVGADDLLKQNDQGQISGNSTILSRKGGPIPKLTPRVRYDDGGGVSPSAAGMPPGLGGQQGAIPPIYYNPATYAPAGAPVGKGVSQPNANTFTAGAIPSLPMARGGVVGFDDGGEVNLDTSSDELQTARDDQMTTALLDQRDAAPTSVADGGYFTPANLTAPATSAASGQGGAPAGTLPMTPEISDGQGNPSKGLIGAIGDGLHWLGDHLGLVGGAQAHPAIAGDPQTQDNRSNFAQGNNVGGMNRDAHKQIATMIDPNGSLNSAERNIAVMEGAYKFMLSQGDSANAGKMAASILQYSVQTSQQYAEEAAKQLYDGNLKSAVDNINHASDAVPDGRLVHVTLDPDGKNVTVVGKDMTGRALWQQRGSAEAILQYATNRGRTGQMQWDALEEQAGKYDPTFRDMAKNRAAGATARVKGEADTEAQTAANDQIAKFGPQFGDPDQPGAVVPTTAPTRPALPGPSVQTASNGPMVAPSPGKSPDTTTAQPASPPPSADSNAPPVALGPTGHGGALPSAPGADIPAPGVQDVDLEHDAGYQNIVAQTAPKYFSADGRPLIGGQPMNRPPPIDQVTLKSYAPQVQAAYNERWKEYTQAEQQNQAAMRADIDGQRRDYTANLTSQRAAAATAHSDTRHSADLAHSDAAAAARDAATAKRQEEQQQRGWTHEEQAPLTPTQGEEKYKGSSPMATTASLPRYAVNKSDGTLDENASAQALGKAYDLPPPGGGAATGGLQRATTVSNIASDATTWNTHMGIGDVHDLVDGLARGVYTIGGKPTPVTRHGQELDQFVVHQQPGDPGVTLFLPRQDGYNIARIKQEFADAQPKPATPDASAPPPRNTGFPGTKPGIAPAPGGFNTPPPPISPRAKWWLDQAIGRGQSPGGLGQ